MNDGWQNWISKEALDSILEVPNQISQIIEILKHIEKRIDWCKKEIDLIWSQIEEIRRVGKN